MNKKMMAAWTVAIAVLASAGPLPAHHSLVQFDTVAPVWVKGTVVRFERVNPHSLIFMDQQREDGQVQRWVVVGGPSLAQLNRMGVEQDILKAGDVIEVCGFATKQPGQAMNGHVVVMPDGRKRFWSDYGQLHQCISPDERDSLIGSRSERP